MAMPFCPAVGRLPKNWTRQLGPINAVVSKNSGLHQCIVYFMLFTKENLLGNPIVVSVGEFSYGSPRVLNWGEDAKLKIGDFCSFADNVTIFTGGNHRSDWVTTYPFGAFHKQWPEAKDISGESLSRGSVVIGNDVWVGYGATIMSGVRVGDGAIIGAKAVVAKDVLPYSIVVGNPAKIVKMRFSDSEIRVLMELKWWDWPLAEIRGAMHCICSSDIEGLRDVYYKKAISGSSRLGGSTSTSEALLRRIYYLIVKSRFVKRSLYIRRLLFNKRFI